MASYGEDRQSDPFLRQKVMNCRRERRILFQAMKTLIILAVFPRFSSFVFFPDGIFFQRVKMTMVLKNYERFFKSDPSCEKEKRVSSAINP